MNKDTLIAIRDRFTDKVYGPIAYEDAHDISALIIAVNQILDELIEDCDD